MAVAHMVAMTIIEAFAHVADGTTLAGLATSAPEVFRDEVSARENLPKEHAVATITLNIPDGYPFVIKRPATPGVPQFRMPDFADIVTVAIGSGNKISTVHVIAPIKGGEETRPLSAFITGFNLV